ncbi:hypothetical protein [Nocardia terpenica]|uniref:hypothetical protein n=1 Tax=Nocardia terpenica TaxID=455432 RepID=UPI0012E757D9|nr:hypothetical protein [Nocardia terpenica]NQE88108.1 hypothetical protein [Nocardia terpenica]
MIAIAIGITAALPATASAIEEDEPGWNCATMGNMICGTDESAEDPTVCYWSASEWLSAYSATLDEPCKFGL